MPNRIIKESICVSDSIDALSWFEEVLFYRLIVNCDDFGRFDGRIAVIKNKLFPLKENLTAKSVKDGINKLASAGLIFLYEYDGRPFLHLPTWHDHQNVRAKRSKYPSPEDSMNTSASICNHVYANVPVIQSNPIQSESLSESYSESVSESRACADDTVLPAPDLLEVLRFMNDHGAALAFFDHYAVEKNGNWPDNWQKAALKWKQEHRSDYYGG